MSCKKTKIMRFLKMDSVTVVGTVGTLMCNVQVVVQGVLTIIGCVAALIHLLGVRK